jgi:hypothetical protein
MSKFVAFFLKLFLIQIFIYSFFTEWVLSFLDNKQINIVQEIEVFLFFFLPLFFVYYSFNNSSRKSIYKIEVKHPLPISFVFLVLPIIYFLILYKYDILTRRIGTENIAIIYGDMNSFDKLFMKLYDQSQYIYLLIGFYTIRLNKKFRFRFFFKFVYSLNLIFLCIFSVFNSRTAVLFFVLLVFLFDTLFNSIQLNVRYRFLFIATFFFILVSSVRYAPLLYLNDKSIIKEVAKNEILYRVNCTVLFNEVAEASNTKGYLWGKTMTNPLLSLFALMGDESSKEKIRIAETGSKQYILVNYLQKDNRDDCSCMGVDSFANFGFLGILFSSLVIGMWVLVIYYLGNVETITSWRFSLIIIFVFSIFFYESDGLSLLFNFVKYLPGAILIALLNPINVKRIPINGK